MVVLERNGEWAKEQRIDREERVAASDAVAAAAAHHLATPVQMQQREGRGRR